MSRSRKPSSPPEDWLPPMLASLTAEYFSDPQWIYERKFDGIRCLAHRRGGQVTLYSRNWLDLGSCADVREAVRLQCGEDVVLDGEVAALADGFAGLQQGGRGIGYYVFDVLRRGGEDLRGLPLLERKRRLLEVVRFAPPLYYVEHVAREGEALYAEACASGWEGVIAKDSASVYEGGRSRRWLKFKCVQGQALVVGGFTDPRNSRVGLGALLVGAYDVSGQLQYAGKVGTGFDTATLQSLRGRLEQLERPTSPFAPRKGMPRDGVHWCAPELVAQVEFAEWHPPALLRHPRFVGLREDKDPSEALLPSPQK